MNESAVPDELKSSIVCIKKNEKFTVTAIPSVRFHEQAKYIASLIPQHDQVVCLLGEEFHALELQLSELLGDMARYPAHVSEAKSSLVAHINSKTGEVTVSVLGYVDAVQRKRFSTKFSVAAALTGEQANSRLNRIIESEESDPDLTKEHSSAGAGLMLQRACSDGPMELFFYPDQRIGDSQKFELKITLRKAVSPDFNALDSSTHNGVISPFPRIIKG